MNTHVIIPIKDIKDIIKRYKKDIDTSEKGGDNIRAAAFTHMIDGLETAAKLGKQISLDEKDKDKDFYKSKAKVSLNERFFDTMQAGEMHCYIEGYKQAQKDLL